MGAMTEGSIKYRILPPEEWDKLIPLFVSQEHLLPSPVVATAAVAEDTEGNILGFLLMQLTFHVEPLWISPDANGSVSWKHLLRQLESLMSPYKGATLYAFAPDHTNIRRLAEIAGFDRLPWSVMRKEVV